MTDAFKEICSIEELWGARVEECFPSELGCSQPAQAHLYTGKYLLGKETMPDSLL